MEHCWTGRRDWASETFGLGSAEWIEAWAEETDATCLLPDGHEGPHEWTPDDQILIDFPEADPSY